MAGFVVAITGGVASGKSAVCALFERAGVTIADADAIAHAIVAPGQPALAEIAAAFGAGVLRADGALDRAQLRERVFADAGERARLEAITHPRIRAELARRCAQAPGAYAIADIPLLAETGARAREAYPWLDRVLVVDAPVALQRARLLRRDGVAAELAERMIAAQATRATRLAIASDVLVNDAGLDFLEDPVRRLDARFRALAAGKSGQP
jgi:dephospho-CoA kinase